jgi:hypothetical protein
VRRKGLESARGRNVGGASRGYSRSDASKAAEGVRKDPDTGPIGPTIGPGAELDRALARALALAVARGDLDVVARIVEELRARRLESAGLSVIAISSA